MSKTGRYKIPGSQAALQGGIHLRDKVCVRERQIRITCSPEPARAKEYDLTPTARPLS